MRRSLFLSSLTSICTGAVASQDDLKRSLQERIELGECADKNKDSSSVEYFPEGKRVKVIEDGAHLFDVYYGRYFKVVVSEMIEEQYVLTQCGLDSPSDSEVDQIVQLRNVTWQRKHFDVPLQFAAAESTVHLGFLAELSLYDRIRFVTSYAVESCWLRALECDADSEAQKEHVDATFMDCGWAAVGSDCSNVKSLTTGVHVPTTQDADPLKTAEYVKFMAVFFNLEEEANRHFNQIMDAYKATMEQNPVPKVVAWIEYDSWGSKFKLHLADYQIKMISDAGGKAAVEVPKVMKDLDGYTHVEASNRHDISIASYTSRDTAGLAFINALKGVDAVVDATYSTAPWEYTYDDFLDSYGINDVYPVFPPKFLTGRQVYRFDGMVANSTSAGMGWFESRLALPHRALEGLAMCLSGTCGNGHHYHFRNIREEDPVLRTQADACETPLPICGEGDLGIIQMLQGDNLETSDAHVRIPVVSIVTALLVALGLFQSEE